MCLMYQTIYNRMLYLVFSHHRHTGTQEKGNERTCNDVAKIAAQRYCIHSTINALRVRVYVPTATTIFISPSPMSCVSTGTMIVQHHFVCIVCIMHAALTLACTRARARLVACVYLKREKHKWAGELFNIGHFFDSKSVLFCDEARTNACSDFNAVREKNARQKNKNKKINIKPFKIERHITHTHYIYKSSCRQFNGDT